MKVVVNFRVDEETRDQARELFEDLGMDMTTALNIFLKQAVIHQGIPFDINRRNDFNPYNFNQKDFDRSIRNYQDHGLGSNYIDGDLFLNEEKNKYGI